jgi:hypothetical protein
MPKSNHRNRAMTPAEDTFHRLAAAVPSAERSQMFGKPCYKIAGKAFVCFFQDAMVFKLTADAHGLALAQPGAHLFDPSGKGRPMKEWVQVPLSQPQVWQTLTAAAAQYVTS